MGNAAPCCISWAGLPTGHRPGGFYLAILDPGDVGAGDAIERVGRATGRESIADVVRAVAQR
jgi:MOSC domain-containing protein YiiM